MLGIFYKNKGTISVFLTLILLPVLLVGGMTVDASRIFMSKIVISDAGEMAMNAGLAQYDEELHDEYGLLVMEQSPEAMQDELEAFFSGSLNGTGMPNTGDYQKILDLLTKSFDAINVQGSEIYQTEVEKQQILEYMKYRAPVCLTELVIDKIKELKDTKKMTEAMEAEMDFSEAMKDCQDEFQGAKETLDVLDGAINSFPSSETIKTELSNTEKDYKEIVAKCLLMRAAIQRYEQKSTDTDMKEMAEQFIKAAKVVDLTSPYSSVSFNKYMNSMYYKNTVEALGGIDKLLQDYDAAQAEQENENPSGEGNSEGETEAQGNESGNEERGNLEDIVKNYKEQETRIEGYSNTLLSAAKNCVDSHSGALNGYWNTANTAAQAARAANDKLKKVKEKLKKAQEKFAEWESKNEALKSVGKSGEMDEEVEKYRKFFFDSAGEGKSNLEELEKLITDVQKNKNAFDKWKDILEKEKFFGQSITKVQPVNQVNKYRSEAENYVSGVEAQYSSLETARGKYISNYEHTDASNPYNVKSIHNQPFYIKLQEYCQEPDDSKSQQEQNEANDKLNQSKEAGEEAKKADSYPTFDWSLAGMALPSSKLSNHASEAKDKLANLNTSGNVKSNQKDVLSKFKEAIKEANSFLDAIDRVVEKGAENLYIAEYAMQMFSYYTVNKDDGTARPDGDIIGISGYSLKEHKAYQAECEYILWGKEKSQENIRNTVMMIFGIRLLFNSFFSFTDKTINGTAESMAIAITGAAPYLEPIVKVVIKLGFAGVETASDISKLKQGYGVIIFKDSATWSSFPHFGDNTLKDKRKIRFDYSEYLRVFLNLSLLAGNETGILARIADCIQVNQPDMDLLKGYTMISVEAKVSSRTTFMRKISDWGGNGAWGFPDDTYTITYQSILGY
ncbi:MAG: hypothetical protein HFH13_13485 [Dorea sp.]|nr:hypothetical protein [Dorea sp.]